MYNGCIGTSRYNMRLFLLRLRSKDWSSDVILQCLEEDRLIDWCLVSDMPGRLDAAGLAASW